MERRALIAAALLLGGCWASHGRPGGLDAGAPGLDAGAPGRDAGPPSTDGGACERAEVNLAVSVELREGPEGDGCALGPLRGDWRSFRLGSGGALEITLDTCGGCEEPNACVITIENLHPEVAAAARRQIPTRELFDVWIETTSSSVNLRDTSLCDGPPAPACPLLFRAGQGDLSGFEDPQVDFAWDMPICALGDGPCDESVYRLAVTGVDPILAAFVAQGETEVLETRGELELVVASSASTRSPCTDEPPPAEWAAWTRLGE